MGKYENEIEHVKRNELATKLRMVIERKYAKEMAKSINRDSTIDIDFNHLDITSTELGDLLLNQPDFIMELAEEVMHDINPDHEIKAKFCNIPNNISISDIRSKHIGKFISVEGFVRKASDIVPLIVEKLFVCHSCGDIIKQPSKNLNRELRCNCGNRSIAPDENHKIDTRWINIEEPFELTEGEKPTQLNCFLSDDLVLPDNRRMSDVSNRIKITGVLRELPKEKSSVRLGFYLECNHITPVETGWERLEISKEDEEKIKELAKNNDIYDMLISSFAPSLYGMNEIKEAVIMQSFGGVLKTMEDGNDIRGDIHILLIGDAASGKTSIMKVASEVTPRSRYVSGQGSSSAGLTATVTKDELIGGWVLEAGALVLTNKGLLCVDEFEKMNEEDQTIFHEAMEKGSVSISKASIIATLPARTSILAGGNPKMSRFDEMMPVTKQITIADTLLSRFDLKFALLDKPNEQKDREIVSHVIKARKKNSEIKPKIKPEFIRKYIAYAKQTCIPEMTEEAEKMLMDFYLKMRKKSGGKDRVAITLRQFEAMIRLSEASAKIQLSPSIRQSDAQRAINIMTKSLVQLGYKPDTNEFDIDKYEGGTPSSERQKAKILTAIIDTLSARKKDINKMDLEEALAAEGLMIDYEIEDILEKLNRQGIIFRPSPNIFQKVK